jgi:hypothetical protein
MGCEVVIERWQVDDKTRRPNSSFDYRTPAPAAVLVNS